MRNLVTLSFLTGALLLATGCGGQGDKLGGFLGDTSARLGRTLSPEELAGLPALSGINLEAPLTAEDFTLFGDHMQAFLVNAIAGVFLPAEPAKLNALVNTYRPDLGRLVEELRTGVKSPEDVLTYVRTIRQAAARDFFGTIIEGETKGDWEAMWNWHQTMWSNLGYPGGPPDLALEAVRELGITGEQGAALIEIGVKMMIRGSRVMNPEGTAAAPGTLPFTEQSREAEGAFMRIGNQAWNDMMNVFTPEQRRKAFKWFMATDRKFQAYMKEHGSNIPMVCSSFEGMEHQGVPRN